MNNSYWEKETWFNHIDFAIIGSGIVGLSCAINLQKRYPKAKIVIFEKGILPAGASTKNAGFACFGSVSELLDDLQNQSQELVVSLVKQRKEGLQQLRKLLGDKHIEFYSLGGYEMFPNDNTQHYNVCLDKISFINQLLLPIFNEEVFSVIPNRFGFKNIQSKLIFNHFEGQLHTGKMMRELINLAYKKGILICNNVEVTRLSDVKTAVKLELNNHIETTVNKVFIATNGFAKRLVNEDVQPARAQVLITKPIKNLTVKGTFHLDKGYYYFRNVGNRILLGGGRNIDFKSEETVKQGLTPLIQNKLEELLKTVILPEYEFEIDLRWSGIMGVGNTKTPIVKQLSENCYCGIRLGGMGVAIGTLTGQKLAELLE